MCALVTGVQTCALPILVAWLGGQGIARKQLADPDAAIRAQDEDVYLRIGDDYPDDWREGSPALVEIVHDSTRQDAGLPVKRRPAERRAGTACVSTRRSRGSPYHYKKKDRTRKNL